MRKAPNMATVTPDGIRQTTATYDKGTHADLINDLTLPRRLHAR